MDHIGSGILAAMAETRIPAKGDRFVGRDDATYEITSVRRQSSDRARFAYVINTSTNEGPTGHRLEGEVRKGENAPLVDLVERWLVNDGVAR